MILGSINFAIDEVHTKKTEIKDFHRMFFIADDDALFLCESFSRS